MAEKILKACKSCSLIGEEDKCTVCGGATSREWQGYLVILDHTRSEIARKMGIQANGRFALRVR
jgi:DNA-directed RNA polymerase subunit E"